MIGGATKSHCKGVDTEKEKSVAVFEACYSDYGKGIIAGYVGNKIAGMKSEWELKM